MRLWLPLTLVFLSSAPPSGPSPAEVIAAHRHTVCGVSCDTWTGVKAVGGGRVRVLSGGRGLVSGKMTLETRMDHFDLKFDVGLPDYPGEHFSFDGKNVKVDFLTPGQRSPFGDFVHVREQLLKQGLFGGTLNRGWPLFDVERVRQVKYRGWKKKQKLHEVEYQLKKGSSLQVRIYLDEEWKHVRTTYTLEISAPMGARPDESARMDRTYLRLTETFSKFDQVDELQMPMVWEIEYSHEATQLGTLWKWSNAFSRVVPNLSEAAPRSN